MLSGSQEFEEKKVTKSHLKRSEYLGDYNGLYFPILHFSLISPSLIYTLPGTHGWKLSDFRTFWKLHKHLTEKHKLLLAQRKPCANNTYRNATEKCEPLSTVKPAALAAKGAKAGGWLEHRTVRTAQVRYVISEIIYFLFFFSSPFVCLWRQAHRSQRTPFRSQFPLPSCPGLNSGCQAWQHVAEATEPS